MSYGGVAAAAVLLRQRPSAGTIEGGAAYLQLPPVGTDTWHAARESAAEEYPWLLGDEALRSLRSRKGSRDSQRMLRAIAAAVILVVFVAFGCRLSRLEIHRGSPEGNTLPVDPEELQQLREELDEAEAALWEEWTGASDAVRSTFERNFMPKLGENAVEMGPFGLFQQQVIAAQKLHELLQHKQDEQSMPEGHGGQEPTFVELQRCSFQLLLATSLIRAASERLSYLNKLEALCDERGIGSALLQRKQQPLLLDQEQQEEGVASSGMTFSEFLKTLNERSGRKIDLAFAGGALGGRGSVGRLVPRELGEQLVGLVLAMRMRRASDARVYSILRMPLGMYMNSLDEAEEELGERASLESVELYGADEGTEESFPVLLFAEFLSEFEGRLDDGGLRQPVDKHLAFVAGGWGVERCLKGIENIQQEEDTSDVKLRIEKTKKWAQARIISTAVAAPQTHHADVRPCGSLSLGLSLL